VRQQQLHHLVVALRHGDMQRQRNPDSSAKGRIDVLPGPVLQQKPSCDAQAP
jgi:hypothetical protein